MRFKVDEDLPVEVAGELRAAGHDAATVAQENVGGASDAQVAGHVGARLRSSCARLDRTSHRW